MAYPNGEIEHVPKIRVVQSNDPTVVAPQHLHNYHTDGREGTDELGTSYPPHTRVVYHPFNGLCSTAYAVSQAGARQALASMGLQKPTMPFDMMIRQFCAGGDWFKYHKCLTTRPPLFEHFRPRGLKMAESDLVPHGQKGDYREKSRSNMMRWSARLNWDNLEERVGEGEERKIIDQYPDDLERLPKDEWT